MLELERDERQGLWRRVIEEIERYRDGVAAGRVTPDLDLESLRSRLAAFDFATPLAASTAVDVAVEGLTHQQVHAAHPRYFGLFNPTPATMGIAADALVAAFNPQLAAWSHSPFAVEVERHLVRSFGAQFGWDRAEVEGTFTSGGMEANHTAVLAALFRAFPEAGRRGLLALRSQPVLYVSAEAHDSFAKAARLSGLGTDAVREVRVDGDLRMSPADLAERLAADRRLGLSPFLVVATAGTTTSGAVDPIAALAEVAEAEGIWLHVDAAWGGAAALVPELAPVLAGLERARSITFDAHKWLSVPMGAGLFLCRHPGILERTFRVAEGYMPRDASGLPVADPFAHSMQWSRRFIGLKVFLSLLVAGWEGYAAAIRHQAEMGELLRSHLAAEGWEIVNRTPLPVVCFVDGGPGGREPAFVEGVAARVVASGAAWINAVRLTGVGPALRACVTSYRTGPADVEALVRAVGAERTGLRAALRAARPARREVR